MPGETPYVGEAKTKVSPQVIEALLAAANAKPDQSTAAEDFVCQHNLPHLFGSILATHEEVPEDPTNHVSFDFETCDDEVRVKLDYELEYSMNSKVENGDAKGMAFVLTGEHSVPVPGGELDYNYSIVLPSDEQAWPEAAHTWKILNGNGVPIDGYEFSLIQVETWHYTNNELFIALLQRGCEDLAKGIEQQ